MQPATRPRIRPRCRDQHDERILDAPVGGVGHVRDAREAVERDVVLGACTRAQRARARLRRSRVCAELRGEAIDRRARRGEQLADHARRARRRRRRVRRFSISRQAVAQRLDQQRAAASDCRAGRPGGRDCAATTQMSPSTSYSIRAERPVRRSPRSSSSSCPMRARRAGGSRSRDRRTTCSCTGSRAGAARRAGVLSVRRRRR